MKHTVISAARRLSVTAAPAVKQVAIPKAPRGKLTTSDKQKLVAKLTPIMRAARPNFWALVDAIGWGTKTTDHEGIAEVLSTFKNRKKVEYLGEAAYRLVQKAWTAHNKADPKNTLWRYGDPETTDCLYHVVGLGKKYYDAFMKQPMAFSGVGKVYKASFGFIFAQVEGEDDVGEAGAEGKQIITPILEKLTKREISILRKYKDLI